MEVKTPPIPFPPTKNSVHEELQDAASNLDLVVNKESGQALPTFRLPGDYFDRRDGPSSGDHVEVFREWMRTLRAIQRTTANRLIRASTEFVTAIQAKEHQRVTETFEARSAPEPDPELLNELNSTKLRVRTLTEERKDLEDTVMDRDRVIRGMRSKFMAAFGLPFEKWNGTPEALQAVLGNIPMN